MLYGPRRMKWQEIDALRLLTNHGKRRFVSLPKTLQTPSHEMSSIASVDVHRLLSRLSGKQREAIALRYLLGMDDNEAAAVLNRHQTAAGKRIQDGLKLLRKIIA